MATRRMQPQQQFHKAGGAPARVCLLPLWPQSDPGIFAQVHRALGPQWKTWRRDKDRKTRSAWQPNAQRSRDEEHRGENATMSLSDCFTTHAILFSLVTLQPSTRFFLNTTSVGCRARVVSPFPLQPNPVPSAAAVATTGILPLELLTSRQSLPKQHRYKLNRSSYDASQSSPQSCPNAARHLQFSIVPTHGSILRPGGGNYCEENGTK